MTRRKLLALTAVVLVGIPLALYLFLFALQAYSVWQASRMLDRLEALRIGDPAQECDRALDGTAPENGTHTIAAGTRLAILEAEGKLRYQGWACHRCDGGADGRRA